MHTTLLALFSSSFLFLLFFLLPHANSLSTVSISQTSVSRNPIICALTQNSKLNCTKQLPTRNSSLSYSRIAGGKGFVCALRSRTSNRSTSIMECWRGIDTSSPILKRIYKGPVLSELRSGNSYVCGIVQESNQIKSWKWKHFISPFDSQAGFSAVSVGGEFVCGLSSSGSILCNGNDATVSSQIPAGNYTSVEAGPNYACALTADGTPICWGETVGDAPAGEKFTSLALGDDRACGLRANGTVACWGQNSNLSIPSDANFIAIEAQGTVFCGVLSNLSLACWVNQNPSSPIFDNVLPGACENTSSCKCGVMPSNVCGSEQSVCSTCPLIQTPASTPPESETVKKSSRWNGKMIAFLVVGIVGCSSLAASIVFWCLVLRQGNGRGSSRVHDSGRLDLESEEANSGREEVVVRRRPVLERRLSHIVSMGSIEEFDLQVLLQVTKNFSPELRIGTGSYGSVYRAELDDGRRVAIKRAEVSGSSPTVGSAKKKNEERDTAFVAELRFLSKLNHKNLVRLLGFYEDAKERVLIYEYMPNGTLHDHLHNLETDTWSPLKTWPGRIKVALDAAKGIEYLHVYAVHPVIHRDIKPSNILLDDTWVAKVSDFGLSLLGPDDDDTHLSLLAAGTLGYIDPEYYKWHQLTSKSDVYSFGVVLLELLTGLKAIHLNENGLPRNVVDFVIPYINRDEIHRVLDPKMDDPTPVEIVAVARVGQLAAECVSSESRNQPPMMEIVSSLEAAWKVASLAPATFFSSPANSSYDED